MKNKIQVEVITLEKDQLSKDAKFIFLVHPQYADWVEFMQEAFEDLGIKDFVVLPIDSASFKAYEIK